MELSYRDFVNRGVLELLPKYLGTYVHNRMIESYGRAPRQFEGRRGTAPIGWPEEIDYRDAAALFRAMSERDDQGNFYVTIPALLAARLKSLREARNSFSHGVDFDLYQTLRVLCEIIDLFELIESPDGYQEATSLLDSFLIRVGKQETSESDDVGAASDEIAEQPPALAIGAPTTRIQGRRRHGYPSVEGPSTLVSTPADAGTTKEVEERASVAQAQVSASQLQLTEEPVLAEDSESAREPQAEGDAPSALQRETELETKAEPIAESNHTREPQRPKPAVPTPLELLRRALLQGGSENVVREAREEEILPRESDEAEEGLGEMSREPIEVTEEFVENAAQSPTEELSDAVSKSQQEMAPNGRRASAVPRRVSIFGKPKEPKVGPRGSVATPKPHISTQARPATMPETKEETVKATSFKERHLAARRPQSTKPATYPTSGSMKSLANDTRTGRTVQFGVFADDPRSTELRETKQVKLIVQKILTSPDCLPFMPATVQKTNWRSDFQALGTDQAARYAFGNWVRELISKEAPMSVYRVIQLVKKRYRIPLDDHGIEPLIIDTIRHSGVHLESREFINDGLVPGRFRSGALEHIDLEDIHPQELKSMFIAIAREASGYDWEDRAGATADVAVRVLTQTDSRLSKEDLQETYTSLYKLAKQYTR